MTEFGEVKVSLPLTTGDYIPNGRTTLGLNQLLPLVEHRKVTLIQSSLREIQMRLLKDANTLLPENIDKMFGLTGLFFAELSHIDSRPIVFAGFGNYNDLMAGSLNKAIAFIDLERSTGMGWSGDEGVRLNNRLLPVRIGVSGVDQQTKRIVSVNYDAEYNFLQEETNSPGRVAFVLDGVGISVSREDGFDFKEGRGSLDFLPYAYVSQYYEGIFTKEMLAKAEDSGQKFTNKILVDRYLRYGYPRLSTPLMLQNPVFAGLINRPEDFELQQSDRLVRIGRKNRWEIKIPEILSTTGSVPKFLQNIK